MEAAGDVHVFRVTVRGRFADLSDRSRSYLASNAAEHSIFVSAYTEEGTFTYDERLAFFNLRYEVRLGGPDAGEIAASHALDEAAAFLGTMGFGFRDLKADVVDMSAMWSSTRRHT